MYETIMDLPLFKGISHDHVSQFVERTHLNFLNFDDGETVASEGDLVETLTYIIRGHVRVRRSAVGGDAIITYTLGAGSVVGADHLFGIDRTLQCDITASGACSAIAITKQQYLALLPTDDIYLVNYLNFLSYHAQRGAAVVRTLGASEPMQTIAAWIATLTEVRATDISIELPAELAEAVAGSSAYAEAAAANVCELTGNTLHVRARGEFLEAGGIE